MNVQVMGGNVSYSIALEFITQVHVWMFQYPHFVSFTFLYSHNQHAFVTSVKVFVNIRYFKSKVIYLCNQCTLVRQEQLLHNVHGILERDNISSRHPHHRPSNHVLRQD